MRAFKPAQPDKGQAFSATQYDNLSDEELLKLINDANKLKGGHVVLAPQVAPVAKRHVDLDALIEANRG